MSRLLELFCCLALILACIGLYGLLSYEVARRTRELGIRMALGAQRRELMRLVVRRGLLLALAGTVIGTGAAMAVTRLMSAMLYNVRPYDPATFAGGCILLAAGSASRVFGPCSAGDVHRPHGRAARRVIHTAKTISTSRWRRGCAAQ